MISVRKVSYHMTKPTKWHVHPAKTQISSMGIRPVWSVFTVRSIGSSGPMFLHANSDDSDQTGTMPRLILLVCRAAAQVINLNIQSNLY